MLLELLRSGSVEAAARPTVDRAQNSHPPQNLRAWASVTGKPEQSISRTTFEDNGYCLRLLSHILSEDRMQTCYYMFQSSNVPSDAALGHRELRDVSYVQDECARCVEGAGGIAASDRQANSQN